MPRWPRRKPEPELQAWSMTAASSRVTGEDARRERNAGLYAWQLRALAYSESLGEIWYAAKFYERALRNLRLIVQSQDPDGSWALVDDPIPNDALASLVDSNGEQSPLLGMYGRQIFLTGEARMFGVIDADTGAEAWEMLSVEEIHVNDQGNYVRKSSPGDPPQEITAAPGNVFRPTGDGAVMFRLWTPSPRFSAMADSPMKACLDICDELLLLTRSVRGEIKSRISNNGILFLPQEMMLPVLGQGIRPDEDPGADGFMRRLEKILETGIQDESSPSSQIPIIVRGPGDLFDKVTHMRFDKPLGEEQAKRDECVKRLAMSLDMPPEALLGIADTNHWGAWQIDESAWKVHIQPVAQTLVENLTSSWFRPLMGDSVTPMRIWYDESEVVNHPDRSTDYKDGFDRFVISGVAYAKAMGAEEAELMKPEEQDRQAELRALAHRGSAATTTPPAGSEGAGPGAAAGGSDPTAATPPPGQPGPPAAKPTSTPPASPGPPAGPIGVPNAARALGAAESAVWRCREVAGSRLRSKVARGALSGLYKEITNVDLAREVFRQQGTDPEMIIDRDALVAGGGAVFSRQLMAYGFDRALADQVVSAAEAHARDTLFDTQPGELPDEIIALCTLGALAGEPV